MKVLKQILEKAGMLPAFQWKVRSKSEPGTFHNVSWYQKDTKFTFNKWHCDCLGFPTAKKNNHFCKHIRSKNNEFKGLTYEENY